MARRVLLFLLLFIGMCARSQDFPMRHYTMEDGMPSNNIYTVYRDSRGFLWIATDKGIARYNGIKFESFTTFDGLADNETFFFQEDYEGRLWCASYNGDLCYYKDGIFHNPSNTPFLHLHNRVPQIYGMYLNKDSSLNVLFFERTYFINIKKNVCREYHLNKNPGIGYELANACLNYKIRPDKFLMVAGDYTIIADTSGKMTASKNQFHGYVTSFRSQDAHYFVDSAGVYSQDLKQVRLFKKDFLKRHTVNAYYSDSINFFYCMKDGLMVNDSIWLLKNCNVTSVTQDNDGQYWISTLNNGIYCLRRNFLTSRVFKYDFAQPVRYCYQHNADIFFALTDNSLWHYDGISASCVFDYPKLNKQFYPTPGGAGYCLEPHGADYEYYNFYNHDYLFIEDVLKSGSVRRIKFDRWPLAMKDLNVTDHQLCIREIYSIYVLNKDDIKAGREVRPNTFSPDSTDHSRIFSTASGAGDDLFFSTINNVYKVENGSVRRLPQFGKISFKSFSVFGKYLLGTTYDNTLVICNNFDSHIRIDSTSATQKCVWQKLYRLDSMRVLVATNNLYRLITLHSSDDTPRYEVHTVENPFIPLDAEGICSDGRTCNFFRNGSITSVLITDLLAKTNPPLLFFSSVKTLSGTSIRINGDLELPYLQSKNLTIAFITQSFGGKNVFYQYSISRNGQDNWRDVKSEEINLVNPGFGLYTIKIRARTMSSVYSAPQVFHLHILSPYWATWWFIIVCVGVTILLAGVAIRYRISYLVRKSKREHDAEMKFIKLEYKALNALMNPHFIFNTLNNVQSLFNSNDKLAANEYLKIFADLIRQNMYNVSKELIPLQKEMALVMNYLILEKLRFEDKLNYEINVDERIDISEILIPPLLIQPIVENSIKHGILHLKDRKGEIQINVYLRQEKLYIEVRDNGPGIKLKGENTLHESFGLDNIRKRIQQLSIIQGNDISLNISEVKDDHGVHKWTVVAIIIPL